MTTTIPAPTAELSAAPSALHEPPAAVRVRGTIALLAGAGETAAVYARFGSRLAADGYVVGVFETTGGAEAAQWLGSQQTPRVLAGADRGAAVALSLAVDGNAPTADALLIGGLPLERDDSAADPSQRTACPVHLGVLADATAALSVAAPDVAVPHVAVPEAEALASISVPVLAVHGGADPLSPLPAVAERLATIPAVEVVETVDGLHDAFNDQSHRSVAATIVLWLERLRAGDISRPIVRAVTR